jgi:hypothetical protein
MLDKQKITCPNCSHEFAVEEVINKELTTRLNAELSQQRLVLESEFNQKSELLEKAQLEFDEKRKRTNEIVQKRIEAELKKKEEELTRKIKEDMDAKLNFLEEDNKKQSDVISSLRVKEVEMLKKEAAMREKEAQLELKVQKEILEARQAIEEKVKLEEADKANLKLKEYEKKLVDLTKQLDEAQRKAQQGSMQLQGEVLELVLEEELTRLYPFDIIDEVPKGVKGADVIHTVRNALGTVCGRIIYESKRTKNFSNEWLEKLKVDQRELGAEIPVLITETMPKDLPKFGQINGVWVCHFNDIKGVSFVLREMLIRMNSIQTAQVNKGDKMEMLYHYLTGPEFRSHLGAIVEGFDTMQDDLTKEKRAMERLWKSREKQIEKVIKNTIHMYGSIRGIAGNAIGTIQQLELPGSEEENDF